jgi:hypothetical protein
MFVYCSVNKLVRLLLVIVHHVKTNVWTFLNPHRTWNLNSMPDFSLQLIWALFNRSDHNIFRDHMLAFLWSLENEFSILEFTVPD